jgi:hypothetical protein
LCFGRNDDDLVMDYVPVSGHLKSHAKKLAKARERHGKEFRTNLQVVRVEPPSRTLQELNQSGKPPAKVRAIKEART